MVATCLHLTGFVSSFVGWIGLIVATSTNDWVVTCGYTITTCRKMDELGSKGLWADCVMATGLYHCKPLVDILILPGMDYLATAKDSQLKLNPTALVLAYYIFR